MIIPTIIEMFYPSLNIYFANGIDLYDTEFRLNYHAYYSWFDLLFNHNTISPISFDLTPLFTFIFMIFLFFNFCRIVYEIFR